MSAREMESRWNRARREARERVPKYDELEALWRDLVGGEPPDRTLDYASKPLARLSDAWPASRGAIEEALRGYRTPFITSWFDVASKVLADYPPPLTDATGVYLTGGGSVYHRFQDCDALRSGQAKAKGDGWNPKLITRVPLEEARRTEGFGGGIRTPCKMCPW